MGGEAVSADAGVWGWAGELDGQPPDETLAEVAARGPATAVELLTGRLPVGGLLVVTARAGRPRPDAGALARLTAAGLSVEVLRLAGAEIASGGPLRQVADRATPPDVLLLDAPDLAAAGGRPIDGLVLRNLVERLRERLPRTRLALYVSGACFVVRHALPGTLLLTLPPQPDDAAPAEPVADLVDGFASALGGGDPRAVVAAGDLLARRPDFDPLSPPARLAEAVAAGADALRSTVVGLLRRHWPAAPDQTAAPGPDEPAPAPRTTAVLYRLLSSAEPDGPRSTFRQVDVARWWCALRADSYETLSAVTTALRHEDLAGANLAYAPSLEHCDLTGADLSDVDGYRLNASDGALDGAALARSCLARGHLKRASLRGADLTGADLEFASFQQADLTGADLTGADLRRALLDQAVGLPSALSASAS
ncbi:Pentapeptide repeat-containing protein [Streptoalloteichus tenebrarius]|uniref:Pentapeptide repeat-containing protein n=1 Tax=Streptoalloteichus tenebrarius (strain ATCC 17920 / DSM 40477 / JCM 4838 / CBS 697.72 / NBRC 16177 / NCIMB 11028 / NRRL B-12390 / A12253. 1 / ISP 5477) TaxID=1933 RepID=A0ABT1I0P6_STRSD|nr:Pentapeptide repeat-containing protein [Streptoalloteichus tenebrarius]